MWVRPKIIQPHELVGDLHGSCGGRDPSVDKCTCPDLLVRLVFRLRTGSTVNTAYYCACCDLPIDPAQLPSSEPPKT